MPSLGVNPFVFLDEFFIPKTRVLGLSVGEDFVILACDMFTQCQHVTDRRTDRQTDGFPITASTGLPATLTPCKKLTAHASYHVRYRYGVKNNYIFGILNPNLAIHYDTFTELRRRIGVFTYETANVKVKSSKNFLSSKNGQILVVFEVWGLGVRKNFDFYYKRHIYMWIHVVCDIPRENWLGV